MKFTIEAVLLREKRIDYSFEFFNVVFEIRSGDGACCEGAMCSRCVRVYSMFCVDAVAAGRGGRCRSKPYLAYSGGRELTDESYGAMVPMCFLFARDESVHVCVKGIRPNYCAGTSRKRFLCQRGGLRATHTWWRSKCAGGDIDHRN